MAEAKNKTLVGHIKGFLNYLIKERSCSIQTRKNYAFYLQRFLKHSKITKAEQVTNEKIKNYQQWLSRKGLKKNTINYHLIALRSFLNYLKEKKVSSLLPEKVVLSQQPRFYREELTEAELDRLLEAPTEAKEKEIIKLRDKAILETLQTTNLKVSELIGLKRNDVLPSAKNARRKIILSQQAKHHLKKYLNKRMDSSPYLFISHDRANEKKKISLTPRSIQRIVNKYSQLAKINKQVTPETFRQGLEK